MCSSAKLLPLACTACNAILGLPDVDVKHRQFDAPIDAPPKCPPIGQTPSYSNLVRQAFLQDCLSYEISRSGTAIGLCELPDHRNFVGVGPAGQPLEIVADIPIPTTPSAIIQARVSPDGERILASENVFTVGLFVHAFERAGDHWQQLADLPLDPTHLPIISTIFSGPTGDAVFARVPTGYIELWYQGGTWNPVPTMFTGDGVDALSDFAFTSDGLRGIVASAAQLSYIDRVDTSSPFRTAVPMTAPTFFTASFTDDCSRIYTTGLGSIAYVDQQ